MHLFLDIETIPEQGGYDRFLEEALSNFRAPSDLTKTKACADLGITGDKAKYTSKDDVIVLWCKEFGKEKAPEVAEHEWRRTSFNGAKGELVSIAWALEDDEVISVYRSATVKDGELTLSSEAEMLKVFYNEVSNKLRMRPAFFVGQFIGGFDLPFLFHRSVINGVVPPFDINFNGRHGHAFYDTQIAWAGYKGRISQDSLCKSLGIEGKPGDIDGSKVWDFVKAGDVARVAEYNRDDVEKNREIYKRLNFIKSIRQLEKNSEA